MRDKNENPVLQVAAIHDLSAYGKASLTIVIPIMSVMGVQVCPLPTALLSTQTVGIEGFTFLDLTPQMREILDHWQGLDLSFDAVYSGFLGSAEQVELVMRCKREHMRQDGIFLVDPVLGDDGILYPTQTNEIVEAMRNLVCQADIITPNVTEACLLLGEPCQENLSDERVKEYLVRLADMMQGDTERRSEIKAKRQQAVIMTSVPCRDKEFMRVVAYDKIAQRFWQIVNPKINISYPGTGDSLASALLGACMQGDSIPVAMARAVHFVYKSLLVTNEKEAPIHGGVLIEKVLPYLASATDFHSESF